MTTLSPSSPYPVTKWSVLPCLCGPKHIKFHDLHTFDSLWNFSIMDKYTSLLDFFRQHCKEGDEFIAVPDMVKVLTALEVDLTPGTH